MQADITVINANTHIHTHTSSSCRLHASLCMLTNASSVWMITFVCMCMHTRVHVFLPSEHKDPQMHSCSRQPRLMRLVCPTERLFKCSILGLVCRKRLSNVCRSKQRWKKSSESPVKKCRILSAIRFTLHYHTHLMGSCHVFWFRDCWDRDV